MDDEHGALGGAALGFCKHGSGRSEKLVAQLRYVVLLDVESESVEESFDPRDSLRSRIRRVCVTRLTMLVGQDVAERFVRLGFNGDHHGTVFVLRDQEEIEVGLLATEPVDRSAGFRLAAPLA